LPFGWCVVDNTTSFTTSLARFVASTAGDLSFAKVVCAPHSVSAKHDDKIRNRRNDFIVTAPVSELCRPTSALARGPVDARPNPMASVQYFSGPWADAFLY